MIKMIGETFEIKKSEIPKEVFDAADAEAKSICESDYSIKNALSGRARTFDDIRKDTLLGKLGEYFIKSRFNYIEDTAKWHDLISPNGVRTEIKTWRRSTLTQSNINKEIRKLRERKKASRQWFFSTKAIVISYDTETCIFEIIDIFDI